MKHSDLQSRQTLQAFKGRSLLSTDDFWRDYDEMIAKGVRFRREPNEADYGTVAVFEDLYGTLWDLIQFKRSPDQSA